jgi:hypothetical protein
MCSVILIVNHQNFRSPNFAKDFGETSASSVEPLSRAASLGKLRTRRRTSPNFGIWSKLRSIGKERAQPAKIAAK